MSSVWTLDHLTGGPCPRKIAGGSGVQLRHALLTLFSWELPDAAASFAFVGGSYVLAVTPATFGRTFRRAGLKGR
jgi:hypothetical protein